MSAPHSFSPRIVKVPIMGDTKLLSVRPWTMAQQDEIMPIVADLVDQYVAWQGKPAEVSIGSIVIRFQREISMICQQTVRKDLESMELKWGDLDGEDLFVIAQAIWSTSISRPGGGGILGKAIATLGPALAAAIAKASPAKSSVTSPPSAPAPLRPESLNTTPSTSAA